jgi:hypothetical protein
MQETPRFHSSIPVRVDQFLRIRTLIATIAVGCLVLRVCATISDRRLPDVVLLFGEVTILIPADVSFVAGLGLD